MNSKQLQYAIELSKSLNFSLVAEQLGISQPALSKQISNLEKSLGVTLFNRKKSPVELTAAGEYFFKQSQELVYKESQLYRSMEAFRKGEKGRLIIGVSPFRCSYLLPDICRKVREKFPEVKIVLQEDGSDSLKRNAAEGKYDFAIINLPVDESVLDTRPIEADTLVLAVADNLKDKIKNLPNKPLSRINFKDCKDLPFVTVGQNQEMRIIFEKICSMANITPEVSMEVIGLNTAWNMACTGIGATLLPLQFVRNFIFADKINLYIPDCNINIRQPAIITRHGQYISEYAQFAIDLLTNTNKKTD